MCRLIVAVGTFDPKEIIAGAVAMASGRNAEHDSTILVHPDGWGAVWRDPASATGLSVLRDVRPATESLAESGLDAIRTDLLAIHLRRASDPATRGPRFTHPLQRPADDWCFMHNGSQPTVHRMLGLERSTFDSAEYFDYLIPAGALMLDEQATLDRLREIPPGGNCGNAVAVRRDRAYVIHWRSDRDLWPRYFTMHQLVEPGRRIVASEVIPSIAPAGRWEALPPDTLMELCCEEERTASNLGTYDN